jgi:hypothetical protein
MYMDEAEEEQEQGMRQLLRENAREEDVMPEWKRASNKQYKKGGDDIEISFQGGFDKKKGGPEG